MCLVSKAKTNSATPAMLKSCPQVARLLNNEEVSLAFFKCGCKNRLCDNPSLNSEKQSCTATFLQDLIDKKEVIGDHVKLLVEDTYKRNYMCNSIESSKDRLNSMNQEVEFFGIKGNGKKFLREIRGEGQFEFLPFESQPFREYDMRISPVNHWCEVYRILANLEIMPQMLDDGFRPKDNPLGLLGTLAHLIYNQQPEDRQRPFLHNQAGMSREEFAEKRVYYQTRDGWRLQGKFDGLACIKEWGSTKHIAVLDRKRTQSTTQKDQLLFYGLGVCQTLKIKPESILTIIERPPYTPPDYKAILPSYRETVFDICEFEYSLENPHIIDLENRIDQSIERQKLLLQNPASWLETRKVNEPLKKDGCSDCFADYNCWRFCKLLRQINITPAELFQHYACLPENYNLNPTKAK